MLHRVVTVRVYAHAIEILDARGAGLRRHQKALRKGAFVMAESDRLFNPSRETARVLARVEQIGPHTAALARALFARLGRPGNRAIYGLASLPRTYARVDIEAVCARLVAAECVSYTAVKRALARRDATSSDPAHEMDFLETFSLMVQDELDRRRSRLLERRFVLSGLRERKDLKAFDWSYNTRLPKRQVLRAGHAAIHRRKRRPALDRSTGYRQESRRESTRAARRATRLQGPLPRSEAARGGHRRSPRKLGQLRPYRQQLTAVELLIIDDLFLRKLSAQADDELAEVLMSRYERASTIVTSNRPFDDWARLLGDTVIITPLLDRLMHHGHLLKFEGKSWRLKEAAARIAQRT